MEREKDHRPREQFPLARVVRTRRKLRPWNLRFCARVSHRRRFPRSAITAHWRTACKIGGKAKTQACWRGPNGMGLSNAGVGAFI